MPESENKIPLSKKKIFLFRSIGILSPFIILIVLEVLLRIFHYGNNLDVFIEYPGNKDFLVLNPAASQKYFTNQGIATTGNSELFKKEKDENTLRIFILGESTTIGYPYFHNGSFHRWLQYRLMYSFPNRKFELINCSLTAVNSYTVLGFAREIVHYQPDAVLIYTGHNEYYGAMGVGSTDKIAGSPLIIRFILSIRSFRLVQLTSNLYGKIRNVFVHDEKTRSGTRMELMVQDQKISYESDLYKRGIAQFTSNLNQTLQIFNHQQIPVYLSTLVSNEKDLKPFISIEPDSTRFPEFKMNFRSGMQAFRDKDLNAASRSLTEANRIYPFYAQCNFTLGSIYYEQGNYDSAKIFFERAQDLDGLRFRAPGELNLVIEKLASQFPNVHIVDTRSEFESLSLNHIIGDELILEHVHPNLAGYALMSDAFYEAMKREHLINADSSQEMSFAQLKKNMPVTKVDSLAGAYKIGNLKRSWPFSESMKADSIIIRTTEEKIAYALANKKMDWYNAMDSLYKYYIESGNFSGAKTVVEGLVLEHPDDPAFIEKTGELYGKLNDYDHAAFYLKKAFELSPSPEQAKTIFVICLKMDKPVQAMPYIDYALRAQDNGTLQSIKQYSQQIIGLERNYKKDTTNIPILYEIKQKYLQMGNKDAALIYNQKILRLDPENKEALQFRH